MWPKEYVELKRIEDLLICGICYEFMDTSVITLCSHNYCSLCIRKYLHYKTQCPACFTETFEKDLRKNKALDEIIVQFLQIRDKLKRSLEIQIQFTKYNETDNISDVPNLLHQSNINRESKIINNKIVNDSPTFKNDVSPSLRILKDMSSPSTSGRPKIPLMFTPKSSKHRIITNAEETKVVICPVCKVTVSELYINKHLDDCLKRESVKEKPQMSESKRKPLPKLVFTLMKDVVIKKKLKEFGLSTQGDRKTLEARLQRYIVLYNAECDKSKPRSVSELVKQCEDEENLEKKVNKTFLLNKLQITKNSEENIIEDERKKYLEAHKDSFESLIKQIKGFDPPKKSSVRRSLLNENIDSHEDALLKHQAVTESLNDSVMHTEQNNFESLNPNVYIPDSDSDTSCPLQMYSSTDPKKCVNIEPFSTNNNDLQNTSQTSNEDIINQSVSSNYSPVKINKKEKDDMSDACSGTSNYDKAVQSVMENSFCGKTLNIDSKDSSNTSKYKKLLQRKKKLCLANEIKYSTSDQEKEDEKFILQDVPCDLSSNDSVDSKLNHGNLRSTNHGVLNSNVTNFSNLEKENISSSPECSGSRSLRKRSRDLTQIDNKLLSGRKKKIKKSPHCSEARESKEESSNILNVTKMECLENEPELRRRLPNVAEETPALRKSNKMKLKKKN